MLFAMLPFLDSILNFEVIFSRLGFWSRMFFLIFDRSMFRDAGWVGAGISLLKDRFKGLMADRVRLRIMVES